MYNDAEYVEGLPLLALLEVNNCLIADNSGNGIYNNAEGGGIATLEITDSILSNNSGEAIHSHGFLCIFCGHGTATVQITDSSITSNGGGIYTDTGELGPTTLALGNSTISGNSGGGIYTDFGAPTGGTSVVNSTMSDNAVEIWYGGAYIKNTIFKVSPGGHSIISDGFSTIMSQGYNVRSDDGGGY